MKVCFSINRIPINKYEFNFNSFIIIYRVSTYELNKNLILRNNNLSSKKFKLKKRESLKCLILVLKIFIFLGSWG